MRKACNNLCEFTKDQVIIKNFCIEEQSIYLLQVSAYDHGEKISRRLDITYKLVDDESGVVTYVALEGDCRFGSEGCSPRNFHITVVLKDYRYASDNIERSHQVTLDIYEGCYLGDSSFASQRYRKIASMGGYPNLSMSDFHEVFNEVIKKAPSEKFRSSNSFLILKNCIKRDTVKIKNVSIEIWGRIKVSVRSAISRYNHLQS